MKKKIVIAAVLLSLLTGCESATYDDFEFPQQEKDTLVPVGYSYTYNDYSSTAPTKEPTLETFSSEDGRCVISRKEHYFDVVLDISDGDHYSAGAAYAEAVLKCDPEFGSKADQYISDMIAMSVSGEKKKKQTDIAAECLEGMMSLLPDEYRDETEGFASVFSGDDVTPDDGRLSNKEARILQLVYDLLGGPKGCAVSVNGKRTGTGAALTADIHYKKAFRLNSILMSNAVVHFRNKDNIMTSVNTLGLLNTVTAVNDSGVSASVLWNADNESANGITPRSCSFTVRQALESCHTAEDAGNFIISDCKDFQYPCSIFLSDKDDSFSAEIMCGENAENSLLRTADTPLYDELEWNCDNCMCAVSRAVSASLPNSMLSPRSRNNEEYVHWLKLNTIFGGKDEINPTHFKELLTIEKTDNSMIRIRQDNMMFMVIADHAEGTLQADFVGSEGLTDKPEFIDLGSYLTLD